MYSANSNGIIPFRLHAGEDVHPTLLELCKQHKLSAGFVSCGIGLLKDPELGFFVSKGKYARKVFPGKFELLNLSGNFSLLDGVLMAHIHVMLANEDYSVFGGHLFEAEVGLTLEGYLQEAVGVSMSRAVEDQSGLPGLLVK